MKNKYLVTAPDGTEIARTTTHDYKFVAFVNLDNKGWFAEFSGTEQGAKANVRKWKNSEGNGSVVCAETAIEEIHSWWIPCETCGRFHCVGHEVETLKQCYECGEVYENEKTCPC